MMQPKDYYKILGVSETATADEIKKAYRKIARASHPDRNPGNPAAEERFKEASEAYEVLSDAEKRHKFDAFRRYGGFAPGAAKRRASPAVSSRCRAGFGCISIRERWGISTSPISSVRTRDSLRSSNRSSRR